MTSLRPWIIFGIVASLVVFTAASGEQPPANQKGIFAKLTVGQGVNIKDEGAAFSISYFEDAVPLPFKVVEVAETYVVVEDIAGTREMVVPVYSVKAVTRLKSRIK